MHYERWRRTGRTEREPKPAFCTVDSCDRPTARHGWCRVHYERWVRTGDPEQTSRIIGQHEMRFWSKVDKTGPVPAHRPDLGPCWVWTAKARANGGYGAFSVGRRMVRAHRFAYELLIGPIPEGMQLDHLCRNRACVRPAHLEVVTQAENISRGDGGKHYGSRTHCKWGHEFTPENTITRTAGGRACRECMNQRKREYRARLKGRPSADQ